MLLKTTLFVLLITANAYAYDRQDNDETAISRAKSHYRNTQVVDLDSEDYDSMVTSVTSSAEASALPEDSMANFANNDDENDY